MLIQMNLMRPLVQVTFFRIFLINKKKSLLKVHFFGWTVIVPFWKEGSLKYFSVIFQRMPNIWNWYGLIQRSKIGFYYYFFQIIQTQKRISLSIQRYKDVGVMEKSVLDITEIVRHQKQGLTTSYVRYIEGTFFVKLRGHNIDTHYSIHNYLWMKTMTIFKNNWMISITLKG